MASDFSVYDIVGVGFGPSNLALAALIEEDGERFSPQPISTLFLERQREFAWHPHMLIDSARMQLSFLKDLATLRNPQSRFTFLKYLQDMGRLQQFVNLRNAYPTRVEYNDYYRWVAAQLAHRVRYGVEVVALSAGPEENGGVETVEITFRDVETGRKESCLAHNVIVATGGRPHNPCRRDLGNSRRIFHSAELLARLERDFAEIDEGCHFVVVGSGQTAAEIFQHLHERYPTARVTAALRRFAYKPADDSHFVNEIFFPEVVDFLHQVVPACRDRVLQVHRDTNYSAVDLDLIEEIYDLLYQQRVTGVERAQLRSLVELVDWVETEDGLQLMFHDIARDTDHVMDADAAILATGYQRSRRHPLLCDLTSHLEAELDGEYRIERFYRVPGRDGFRAGVYLQGFSESTHGLADTLLSNLAIRSGEVLEHLLQHQLAREPQLTA